MKLDSLRLSIAITERRFNYGRNPENPISMCRITPGGPALF